MLFHISSRLKKKIQKTSPLGTPFLADTLQVTPCQGMRFGAANQRQNCPKHREKHLYDRYRATVVQISSHGCGTIFAQPWQYRVTAVARFIIKRKIPKPLGWFQMITTRLSDQRRTKSPAQDRNPWHAYSTLHQDITPCQGLCFLIFFFRTDRILTNHSEHKSSSR